MGGGGQQYYLESGTIYNDNPLNSSGPVHRQQFSNPRTPQRVWRFVHRAYFTLFVAATKFMVATKKNEYPPPKWHQNYFIIYSSHKFQDEFRCTFQVLLSLELGIDAPPDVTDRDASVGLNPMWLSRLSQVILCSAWLLCVCTGGYVSHF